MLNSDFAELVLDQRLFEETVFREGRYRREVSVA
jgi:hypothetical protein